MYVVPTIDDFDSDTLNIYITDTYFIRIRIVDEYVEFSGIKNRVNGMVIEAYITVDGQTAIIRCPSIIGMKNEIIAIITDDKSLLGELVSVNNLGKWGLEIVE